MYSNIKIDNSKIVLSSKSRIFKTEQFVKQTGDLLCIDKLLNKISESILLALSKGNLFKENKQNSYIVSTLDNKNKLFFKFGENLSLNFNLNKDDIIFYKFITDSKVKLQDKRLLSFFKVNDFNMSLKTTVDNTQELDFSKLYILSNTDKVNFPLLNKEQEKIVTIEDNNVVVQGVAGSGKTNICIDKIIYCACRRYVGKVIYSTYSHALVEDTKEKINLFSTNIKNFVTSLKSGNVEFIDLNHKVAIENKLGIWLDVDDEQKIIEKLEFIVSFLENKVDYFMIEDLYSLYGDKYNEFSNEQFFIKEYLKKIKNYNVLTSLDKIKYISYELIYKEIYGLIFGWCENVSGELSLQEYIDLRKDSFSKQEAECIYYISQDYKKYMQANGIVDNNIASRILLDRVDKIEKYSLVVLDEVQDFTQINLKLFKALGRKMFCVGDVLQMINPTYFSFAYLKRLLFEKDITNVVELKNNYRNSEKIEEIINKLCDLNVAQFGSHSFVLKGKSIDNGLPTKTVYVNDGNFINSIENESYADVTIVVSSIDRKNKLREVFNKQEILTVSEIKGLERNCIILLDILSDNSEKWDTLNRHVINKKKAEENSVYRYYFNLFYVGLSRAKQNLFVVERKNIELFNNFFKDNFEVMNQKNAFNSLNSIALKMELKNEEVISRIEEFIKLEQYDNAKWLLEKLDSVDADKYSKKIDIFEKYVRKGDNKQAGIELWRNGLLDDAKKQFTISHDEKLIELIDSCAENSSNTLEYDIVQFYLDVLDNDVAKGVIIDTLNRDVEDIKNNIKKINENLKHKRG